MGEHSQKKGTARTHFWPMWPNRWMDQDTTSAEESLGAGEFVLDGVAAPPPKGHVQPPFSACAYCSQLAWWMKTPFGTEVNLGPYHVVLDGDPATPPPRKGHSSPSLFSAHMSIVATVVHAAQLLLSSCIDNKLATEIHIRIICKLLGRKTLWRN